MTFVDKLFETLAITIVVVAFVACWFGVGWLIGSFLNSFIRVW